MSMVTAALYDIVRRTSLEEAPKLSRAINNRLLLKREDTQPIHSFKIRGAYNKMLTLDDTELARGVITASAGNHAQGVALSAQKLGCSALIVMPQTTPAIKVEAVKSYGGEVALVGDSYSDAYAHCQEIIKDTGRVFIHPFDDPAVIEGQETVGLEIMEDEPETDYIFVPVGGGGLLAGIAQAVKKTHPNVKIIGVEPLDSNAMQQSLKLDKRIALDHVGIFADGVAVKQVGEHTFDLARQYVDEVVTVTTDQICAAMKAIFEETRAVVEPAGALAVAGAVRYVERDSLLDCTVAAVCSGANISFEKLQFIAQRTLMGSGKEVLLSVKLPEKPGALHTFCTNVINGHSITEFNYRLRSPTEAQIFVGINVQDPLNKSKLFTELLNHDYTYTDLSTDEIAKEHIRHMVGGPAPTNTKEHLYHIIFPERPGALTQFLQAIGDEYNISLFHYRGLGGDNGRVLIGFEADNREALDQKIQRSGYAFTHVTSPAADIFLR